MHQAGFITLNRALFDHPLWQGLTPGQRCVLIAVIEMANWKDGRWWHRLLKKELKIPRGSFVASQSRIAQRANVSRKVVRGALDQLASADFITRCSKGQGSGHAFTIITVRNYSKYQDVPESGAKGRATAGNTGRPLDAHKRAPIEQRNKKEQRNNTESHLRRSSTDSLPEPAYQLSDHFRDGIVDRQGTHRLASPEYWTGSDGQSGQRPKWAKTFDLMHRKDGKDFNGKKGRPWDDMRRVIDWVLADDFWFPNCQCPSKLRKQYDTLDLKSRQRNGVTVGEYVEPKLAGDWDNR